MENYCIITNPIVEKIPENMIDIASWSIVPLYNNHLINNINYNNFNQKGLQYILDDNILAYDLTKMIILRKNTNTTVTMPTVKMLLESIQTAKFTKIIYCIDNKYFVK